MIFLVSNSIHATSQSLNKSLSDPPGEEHSEPPIRQGLNLQNLLVHFGQTNSLLLGLTEFIKLI